MFILQVVSIVIIDSCYSIIMDGRRNIVLFRQFKNRSIPLGHVIKRCLAIKIQFEDLELHLDRN